MVLSVAEVLLQISCTLFSRFVLVLIIVVIGLHQSLELVVVFLLMLFLLKLLEPVLSIRRWSSTVSALLVCYCLSHGISVILAFSSKSKSILIGLLYFYLHLVIVVVIVLLLLLLFVLETRPAGVLHLVNLVEVVVILVIILVASPPGIVFKGFILYLIRPSKGTLLKFSPLRDCLKEVADFLIAALQLD